MTRSGRVVRLVIVGLSRLCVSDAREVEQARNAFGPVVKER